MNRQDPPPPPMKGRGATFNPANRFRRDEREHVDDGWRQPVAERRRSLPPFRTSVTIQRARTIITRNDSPDVPFTQSINPYQGCEHGCIYCYARPSHAYLDLSPGLDFETKLFAKPDARGAAARGARQARLSLRPDRPRHEHRSVPADRARVEDHAAACSKCSPSTTHPFSIVTKSALVERDIDIIAPMAAKQMARVYLSITSLDGELARKLEPRAAAPHRRLQALQRLSEAGIPVGVMVAPIIPQLNDRDLEAILQAAADHGAREARMGPAAPAARGGAAVSRMAGRAYPQRAAHVMSLMQQMRGGHDYDSAFGTRMRGEGHFAALLQKRFDIACKRLGLDRGREHGRLDTSRFTPPVMSDDGSAQGTLF